MTAPTEEEQAARAVARARAERLYQQIEYHGYRIGSLKDEEQLLELMTAHFLAAATHKEGG